MRTEPRRPRRGHARHHRRHHQTNRSPGASRVRQAIHLRRRPTARVVSLTHTGRRLVDDLLGVHLANEAALLAPLTISQRNHLAALLGELAELIESPIHADSTIRGR